MLGPTNLDTLATFGGVARVLLGQGHILGRAVDLGNGYEPTEREKAGHTDSHTVKAGNYHIEKYKVSNVMPTAPSRDTTTATPPAGLNAHRAGVQTGNACMARIFSYLSEQDPTLVDADGAEGLSLGAPSPFSLFDLLPHHLG
ncbi:hypothetical protein NMY22_g9285 [Coprinellus aureogranulatus]|nr:hypothetical protein NMY22_g9285 [Coprinellus aureogranulatus]